MTSGWTSVREEKEDSGVFITDDFDKNTFGKVAAMRSTRRTM